ncbi:DUF58 domain-containing protein [Asticcacaulis sp. EMRT-3]|uniref:DUF58 domain-containing protein n=1 Tax=Asticcacaulis sp. EMRT-3 TaxID=3040349 RepID=UPI0024AF71A2|nr:DUF58 domain-containing protein [Asticcacaulis sp. EMRT-3]MDI7776509.1 DUF58 domain-containing protein [Asticcacaulis sp. EMRT-3]
MAFSPAPRLLVLSGLCVPAAIGVGLYAPGVWPYVVLAAVLLFAAALLDGMFAPVGQGLDMALKLPPTLDLGREADIPFTLDFTRWRKPARLELRLGLDARLQASSYDRALMRGEDGRFHGSLRLKALTRGKAQIDAVHVRWRGFLGLVFVQTKLALDAALVVTPDLHGVEQDAANLFSLDNIYGIRVQNQLFNGSEYHALREYDTSQDHRRIDWRSSSRHMKLYSREYQAERNHHIVLAYDTGRLMGEPLAGLKRLDRAIYAGLLLGYTALKVGDHVRSYAFAARPHHITPALSGGRGFDVLKYQLSALEDSPEESNHTLALADLNAKVARRSLIVLFSDFIDEISADLMIESLQRLSKKHLVLFIAFRDEVVEELMNHAPDTAEDVTRAVFARRLASQRERVLAQLRRQGIEVLEAPTETLATAIVDKYLALKRADRL